MKYLADTSAVVRIERGQVDPAWDALVERGLVALCEPVLAETMLIADAKGYSTLENHLLNTYTWATVPGDIWEWVGAVRRELVPHGAHRALSVADLVVAATAIRLKLEVLHEDADFETAARHIPQLRQRRISEPPPA